MHSEWHQKGNAGTEINGNTSDPGENNSCNALS